MDGKPRKLDEQLIQDFSKEVEDGLPFIYCCDLFSVSHGAFISWMKQGESDFNSERVTIHSRFFTNIKSSYAKYIRASKKVIRKGEPGWQGQAWWLERTNKEFILNSENADSVEPVIVKPYINKNNNK